ncbi:hypothetical protein KBX00_28975, partial [Micromonospora sp. C95]|nr:hypothetical protein [Micromonospora sp. C95]
MNTMLRKSVLGIAGLAFTGGLFAGPVAAHADTTPAKAAAVAAVQGDVVRADKPDTSKVLPHGTPSNQSTIELNDEQTANVKAIIAATKKAGMDERAA